MTTPPAAGRRLADTVTALAKQFRTDTAAALERLEVARAEREAPAFAEAVLPLVEGRRRPPAYAPLSGGLSPWYFSRGRQLAAAAEREGR